MTIHEFGKENKEIILLLHPSVVRWDYFEYVIPLLEKQYHLIIPALPGYDPDEPSDFTSVEQIADELNTWLKKSGYVRLYAIYGCSMGGSIALMAALGNAVQIDHCIMDGGIPDGFAGKLLEVPGGTGFSVGTAFDSLWEGLRPYCIWKKPLILSFWIGFC